jgi:hypothetical protein
MRLSLPSPYLTLACFSSLFEPWRSVFWSLLGVHAVLNKFGTCLTVQDSHFFSYASRHIIVSIYIITIMILDLSKRYTISKYSSLFPRNIYATVPKGRQHFGGFQKPHQTSSCGEFHDSPRCQTVIREWCKR